MNVALNVCNALIILLLDTGEHWRNWNGKIEFICETINSFTAGTHARTLSVQFLANIQRVLQK